MIICDKIPSLEATINEKLLDILCLALSGEKFRPPGSPVPMKPFSAEVARSYRDNALLKKTGEANNDVFDSMILTKASF